MGSKVYKFRRNGVYYLKWFEGDRECRLSTGCRRATDADRARAAKEAQLDSIANHLVYGYEEFVDRYTDDVLRNSSKRNRDKFRNAANKLEKLCKPELVSDITTEMLVDFTRKMRDKKLSDATIFSYLTYLKKALKYAAHPQINLIAMEPLINKPKLPKDAARGRPIALEEFERMKMKAAEVVGVDAANSFKRFMDGLWLSGLRPAEAMKLWWKRERSEQIVVIVSPASVRLQIPALSQKRREFQMYRPAVEFQSWLRKTHQSLRCGPVFSPLKQDGTRHHRADTVGKRISEMGEKAGVVVEVDDHGPVKFASAKDFRASFAMRLMKRALPTREIQLLMRHASIVTTQRYYATLDPDGYDRAEGTFNGDKGDSVVKDHFAIA